MKAVNVLLCGLVIVSLTVVIWEWRAIARLDLSEDPTSHNEPRGLRGSARWVSAADRSHPDWLFTMFKVPPDIRHKKCRQHVFPSPSAMPRTTMIIPYLHETLEQMRGTVASILWATNMDLLDHILFIDDGNEPEHKFIKELESLHPKIKVHSNERREGLIRSKIIGASMVKSPVLIFMEPHCVVNRDWLEPIITRMLAMPKSTIMMPVIDVIPENDFGSYRTANVHVGGFDWSLTFNWMQLIHERNRSYQAPDPYPTPALSGGIFAIWNSYWQSSGTYDANMTEWGGEHIEMSLRTWTCGGRVEILPCSRIGHVFRAKNPYVVHIPQVVRNLKRAALVWLDEHVEDFYISHPSARNMEAGDVSERIALRKKLQCKPMSWYINEVYPELLSKQPRRR